MIHKKEMIANLIERFENKDMGSKLDKEYFKGIYKDAVREFYPRLKEKYADQSIYGISFEIANVVQSVYADDFKTFIYFNTEEMYQENIEDCEEDELSYYRFEPWAEWDVMESESLQFDKVQDYLQQNSLYVCSNISDDRDELGEAAAWYEEMEDDFSDAFDKECEQIRLWLAEALGELRKEGFWEEQGNAGLYVLPFGGECDIEQEEMIETYRVMDCGYHGEEYLEYLEENI